MISNYLILDVSTAALPNVADYLEPADSEARKPPSNYTKADSIAEWRRKDYDDDLKRAGLDVDLAMVTGLGVRVGALRHTEPEGSVRLANGDVSESYILTVLSRELVALK